MRVAAVRGRPELGMERRSNAQEILEQMKTEMRRMIYDLHPAALRDSAPVPAVEAYIQGQGVLPVGSYEPEEVE